MLEWFLEVMIRLRFMRFEVRTDVIYALVIFGTNDSGTIEV